MNDSINSLNEQEARAAFMKCCGASRWADAMAQARPFTDRVALNEMASSIWSGMDRKDILEAFDHHPRIGADLNELRKKFSLTASLSESEQSSVVDAAQETLVALRDGNRAYEARYDHIFIVCATGKNAAEMLSILESRMNNDVDTELRIAAGEQGKITQLRLENIKL